MQNRINIRNAGFEAHGTDDAEIYYFVTKIYGNHFLKSSSKLSVCLNKKVIATYNAKILTSVMVKICNEIQPYNISNFLFLLWFSTVSFHKLCYL